MRDHEYLKLKIRECKVLKTIFLFVSFWSSVGFADPTFTPNQILFLEEIADRVLNHLNKQKNEINSLISETQSYKENLPQPFPDCSRPNISRYCFVTSTVSGLHQTLRIARALTNSRNAQSYNLFTIQNSGDIFLAPWPNLPMFQRSQPLTSKEIQIAQRELDALWDGIPEQSKLGVIDDFITESELRLSRSHSDSKPFANHISREFISELQKSRTLPQSSMRLDRALRLIESNWKGGGEQLYLYQSMRLRKSQAALIDFIWRSINQFRFLIHLNKESVSLDQVVEAFKMSLLDNQNLVIQVQKAKTERNSSYLLSYFDFAFQSLEEHPNWETEGQKLFDHYFAKKKFQHYLITGTLVAGMLVSITPIAAAIGGPTVAMINASGVASGIWLSYDRIQSYQDLKLRYYASWTESRIGLSTKLTTSNELRKSLRDAILEPTLFLTGVAIPMLKSR